jgi:hypothetical protein
MEKIGVIGSEINTVRSVSDVNSVFGLSLLSFFGIEFSFEFFRDELSLSSTWELNNPTFKTYFFLLLAFSRLFDEKRPKANGNDRNNATDSQSFNFKL